MTASGSARSRFRRALRGGDPQLAMTLAGEVEGMTPAEAFGLVLLLARAGDPRYDRAAQRVVARAAGELGASLGDAALLTTALALLGASGGADDAARRTGALLEDLGARGALRELELAGPRPASRS